MYPAPSKICACALRRVVGNGRCRYQRIQVQDKRLKTRGRSKQWSKYMRYRDFIGAKACSVFLLCGPCPGCIYLCLWGTSTEGLYLADRLQIECRKGPCDSFVLDFKHIYEGWDNRPSQRKKDVAKEDAAKQKATNPKLKSFCSHKISEIFRGKN